MVNIEDIAWDPAEFEKGWIATAERIVNELMANAEIQEIKNQVRSKGHVAAEDRDIFITKVNEIKNKIIEAEYGQPDSETYLQFVHSWQHWLKLKGKDRPKGENMFEDNINHLLYGSTPDPDLFLRDFNIYTDIK